METTLQMLSTNRTEIGQRNEKEISTAMEVVNSASQSSFFQTSQYLSEVNFFMHCSEIALTLDDRICLANL